MAYERPQVTVDQNITTTPTSIERDQPSFVFGPNYELHRYGDSDEKEGTAIGTYYGTAMPAGYPGVVNDAMVDKGYTKLFGDNVVVRLAELGGADLPEKSVQPSSLAVNGGYTVLFFEGKAFVAHLLQGDYLLTNLILRQFLAGYSVILSVIRAIYTAIYTVI